MKPLLPILVLLAVSLPTSFSVAGDELPSTEKTSRCDIGPVTRSFGQTEWLVYSCTDGPTLVIVSAQGNPATPCYFALYPKDSGYLVVGEGNGQQAASDAAYADIKALSPAEIESLANLTRIQ
jgi:hypothetical protein